MIRRKFPTPCRRYLAFIALALGVISQSAQLEAAPTVVQSPSTQTIGIIGAQFIFSEAMSTAGVDVTMSGGGGFDPGKVTCTWFGIPGFDLPSLLLDCAYEGGWPSGVEVSWTINGGNSGVIQSTAGEALAEVSGTFTTPGTPGGNPDPDPGPDPTVDPEAPIPTVFASPGDGMMFISFPGVPTSVSFSFEEPMQTSLDIEWSGGEWACGWSSIPQAATTLFECSPQSTLAPGTYTWTLNGSDDTGGFVSQQGGRLAQISGSVIVAGGDGGGGGLDFDPQLAMPCDPTGVSTAFPKRMALCGEDVFSWTSAFVTPQPEGTGYMLTGDSPTENDGLSSLALLDGTGLTQWIAYADEPGVDLLMGTDPNIVLAHSSESDRLRIGAIDVNNPADPIYQHQLALNGDSNDITYVRDNQAILMDADDGVVTFIAVNADGQIAWSTALSSDGFEGTASSGFGGFGDSRAITLTGTEDGFMLISTQTTSTNPAQPSHTVTLVKLNSSGAVSWSKKAGPFEGITPPFVRVLPSGAIYITVLTSDTSNQQSPTFATELYKISSQGSVAWGKRFENTSLTLNDEFSNGKVIVSGSTPEGNPINGNFTSVLALLGSSGNVERKVTLSAENGSAQPFAFVNDSTIFVTLTAFISGQTVKPILGVVDEGFSNFTWKTYAEPHTTGFLLPDHLTTGAIFGAFDNEARNFDVFRVTEALAAEGGCPVLEDAAVTTVDTVLSATNASLSLTNASVSAGAADFNLSRSNLSFTLISTQETLLCGDPGGPGSSSGDDDGDLTIQRVSSTQGQLEFPSETGLNYTIERSSEMRAGTWEALDTIPGNGSLVQWPFTFDPAKAFFRLNQGQ